MALPTRGRLTRQAPVGQEEVDMKRQVRVAFATLAIALPLSMSPQASARTLWVCEVPDVGTVTFVSAADAALHGIDTANATAGTVFHDRFGETCHVESG
jgi:hypothetical protein